MFADFHILGSSSKGNCALLNTGNTVSWSMRASGKRICALLGDR